MDFQFSVASVYCGGPGVVVPPNSPSLDIIIENSRNIHTPCEAYQSALEIAVDLSDSEVLIYLHDDVTIHDADWASQVLQPFSDPNVAVVGMGGATALGHRDLYKHRYSLPRMARGGYASNQTDWQTHGQHLAHKAYRRVAVLDAFCMAVRREWLVRIGGWPVTHLTHHCLDLWLACEAARDKKETWTVGTSVTHHGGGSSTKPAYREAKWLQGESLESDHQAPHVWLWSKYCDVLPLEVKG